MDTMQALHAEVQRSPSYQSQLQPQEGELKQGSLMPQPAIVLIRVIDLNLR